MMEAWFIIKNLKRVRIKKGLESLSKKELRTWIKNMSNPDNILGLFAYLVDKDNSIDYNNKIKRIMEVINE